MSPMSANREDKKTSLFYRFIRFWVKFFSPKYEMTGLENLPEGGCVIVGNHCHIYGPVAAELYTPGRHYIWCAGEMMHKEEVADYAYRDFWSNKPGWNRWFFRILSYLITPLAVCIFNNAHTIGVYHDARVFNTFRETEELLEGNYRIVIFPEHNVRYNNIVYEFQDKFTDLARTYKKKTGRDLAFVPAYLAPRLKSVTFGTPCRFDMELPANEARHRLSLELMESITDMALALPEHTVIPYPNMSSAYYPKSRPVEYYQDEETKS